VSEPKATAKRVSKVAPGVWRWKVHDERIDFESDAYAVSDGRRGVVLIDPLPLAEAALEKLGRVTAICLTAACHQRAAWRYRRAFRVPVYAPKGSRAMEGRPDRRYREGDALPGRLRPVHTPGPERAHYALLREGRPRVLFCADLVMRAGRGALAFIPAEYHDDPAATRTSVRTLLGLRFSILCLSHGPPVTKDPHRALARALERDTWRP
jgi:glyoxylase-like metal-dependent hydrolase (beta-lactamase superfamily II)